MFWSLLLLFAIGAVAIAAIIVSVFSLNSDKSVTTSGNLTVSGDVIASNVTSSNSLDIARIGNNTKNITSSGNDTGFVGNITATNIGPNNKQDVETVLGRTQYMDASVTGLTNFGSDIRANNLTGTNSGDQNIFSSVNVSGQPSVVATSTSTALNLVAGSGVTLTTNNSNKSVTISSTGGGGSGPTWTTTSDNFTSPTRLYSSAIERADVSSIIPNFFQFIGGVGNYLFFCPTIVSSSSPIKIWTFVTDNYGLNPVLHNEYTLTGNLPTNCYGVIGEIVGNTLVLGVSGDDKSNVFCFNTNNGIISNQTIILERSGTSYISGLRLKQVYVDPITGEKFGICTWCENASSGSIVGCQFYWVRLNINSFIPMMSPTFTTGLATNYSDTKIKLSTSQIIVSTGIQTINFFDYVINTVTPSNPPTVNTGQIITLPDNTPQYLNPNIIFDLYSDEPKPIDDIHICFPGYDNTNRKGGYFITYRYISGSWNQIKTWSLSDYYTVDNNSYWGGYVYNGGYYNPTTNNNYGYGYFNSIFLASPSTCRIAQIGVTSIASSPFLQIKTIPDGIFYPLGSPFTGVNNFNIYLTKGTTYTKQISTTYQTPIRIISIIVSDENEVTLQWQTTNDSIKETSKLAVSDGGYFKLPVTSLTTVSAQYPALIDGYTFIDPTSGLLKVYYNGVFRTVNWT